MFRYILLLSFTTMCWSSFAQTLTNNSSIIRDNVFTINPARTGSFYHFSGDKLSGSEATAHISNYWIGNQSSNSFFLGSFHTALKSNKELSKFGLGLNVFNDKSHILSRTGINLSYAYKINFKENVRLSFGLNTSYLNQSINLTNAVIKHPDDPDLLNGNWNGNYFNIGSGANFWFSDKKDNKSKLVFDFAANNLLNSLYNLKEGNYLNANHSSLSPAFFLQLDYTLTLAKDSVDAKQKKLELNDKKERENKFLTDKIKEQSILKQGIKDSNISDSLKIFKLDSIDNNLNETLEMINKAYENGAKNESSTKKEGFAYSFNPFFATTENINMPWEFHLGIRHAVKFKGVPFKLLFGNSFQIQTNNFDAINGRLLTINSFIGCRISDHFSFVFDLDNNINTYNRNNDVFRIGTSVKYNIF